MVPEYNQTYNTNFAYSLLPQYHSTLLQFLVTIIDRNPQCFPPISKAYYTYLSDLCSKSAAGNKDKELIFAAIKIPLVQHVELGKGKILCYMSFSTTVCYLALTSL